MVCTYACARARTGALGLYGEGRRVRTHMPPTRWHRTHPNMSPATRAAEGEALASWTPCLANPRICVSLVIFEMNLVVTASLSWKHRKQQPHAGAV